MVLSAERGWGGRRSGKVQRRETHAAGKSIVCGDGQEQNLEIEALHQVATSTP